MSRIGKMPVTVALGASTVQEKGRQVTVKGPKGSSWRSTLRPEIDVEDRRRRGFVIEPERHW